MIHPRVARGEASEILVAIAWRDDDWGRRVADIGRDPVYVWASSGRSRVAIGATKPSGIAVDAGSGDCIAADARVDNRAELWASLGIERSNWGSDAELLLKGWRARGSDFIREVAGDFAFVIHEAESGRLVAGRDHFGVRPLYFAHLPGVGAVLATNLPQVVGSALLPRRLMEIRVADYLLGIREDWASTLFEGARRVPPAHLNFVDRASVVSSEYWRLRDVPPLSGLSAAEAADAYWGHLKRAVSDRAAWAMRPGALMSGGLDSSSIVAALVAQRQALGLDAIETFSAVYPGFPASDEREYVEAMRGLAGLRGHDVPITELDVFFGRGTEAWRDDEPIYVPQATLTDSLFRGASQYGVDGLLDGFGGDVTTGWGEGHLADLARRGQLRALRHELLAVGGGHLPPWPVLRHFLVKPLLPRWARLWRLRAVGRHGAGLVKRSLLRAEFAARVDAGHRLQQMEIDRGHTPRSAREDQLGDLASGAWSLSLAATARQGRLHKLRPLYPLFDRRLVEFVVSLPGGYKFRDGMHRFLPRMAVQGHLPEAVRLRSSKANVSPQMAVAMGATEVAGRLLSEDVGDVGRFVDLATYRARYATSPSHLPPEIDQERWRVGLLALWLEAADL